jgi:predicted outer membrane repeat protein
MNKSIQKPSVGNAAKKPSAFVRPNPYRLSLAIVGTSGLVFGIGFAGSNPAFSNGVPNCAGREVIAAGKSPSERVSAIELMAATPGVVCLNGVFELDDVVVVEGDVTFYGVGNSSSIRNPLGTVFNSGTPDSLLTIDNLTISGSENAISGYNILIINSTFSNNTSESRGGAIAAQGNVTISSNSTFSNNTSEFLGGAIFTEGSVSVSNSTFSNNTSEVGGAIFTEGSVSVSNSTFSNNTSEAGGAIAAYGSASVSNSTFTSNSAFLGGAFMGIAEATFSNSTFSNNTSDLGGAICGYAVVVSGSTFASNGADNGGAIFAMYDQSLGFPGSVDATNSTFVNNSAVDEGGAIYATEGDVHFSTFVDNLAATPNLDPPADTPGNAIYKSGITLPQELDDLSELPEFGENINDGYLVDGDLYIWDGTEWDNTGSFLPPEILLGGNIFAGNSPFPQLGIGAAFTVTPFTDAGGNIFSTSSATETDIVQDNSPVFGASLTSLFGTNSPVLATNAPNTNGAQTIALAPGSPALNAVPDLAPFNLITLDQRGQTRSFPADAGAFEGFVIPTSTPTSTTPAVLAKTGNENLFWSTLASGTLIVFGTLVAVVISRIRRRTSNL